MKSYPQIAFEGTLLNVRERDGRREGWIEYRGAWVLVDLTLVPSAKPGEKLLIHGRIALSKVEEENEICR